MIGRRAFLRGLTTVGAAGIVGAGPRRSAANPPLETTRVRLAQPGGICQAPKWLAEELLRAEGFTDVQYTHGSSDAWRMSNRLKALGAGETDFDLPFAPDLIVAIEGGQPLMTVGGAHVGCFELFAGERIRAIRDLRSKTIGVREPGSVEHLFLTIILSYIGLDPTKDVRWLSHPPSEAVRFLAEGKIDAWLGFPPMTQELRARKIGHVLLDSTTDQPWRHYFCCMITGNRDFVRRHPVATKRVIRALMKANELCALAPERAAQAITGKGDGTGYEYALQTMKNIPYGAWRDYDAAATMRFYALRLHEAGLAKSSPQKILAQGTDWRFVNELKKELKG